MSLFKRWMSIAIGAVVMFVVAGPARAADRKAELQQAFEQRFPQLREYKSAGKVGETTQGLVEAVKSEYLSDAKLKKLIDDENRDRKELYAQIAKETNATPEFVAEQNARRNYQRAKPGEYLRTADGRWEQKK